MAASRDKQGIGQDYRGQTTDDKTNKKEMEKKQGNMDRWSNIDWSEGFQGHTRKQAPERWDSKSYKINRGEDF